MSVDNRRKAIRQKYEQAGTYPLAEQGSFAVGCAAQPLTHELHEVLLGGVTGIVATQFGGHNMGSPVGRQATGAYGVSFPDLPYVSIQASVAVPTGGNYNVSMGGMSGQGRIVGATGQAQLNIFGLTGGTPCNPVTGTVVTLDFTMSAD